MLQRPEISVSLIGHLAHIFLTYMHKMFWDTVLNNYWISKIRNADSVAGIIKHYVFLGKTLPSQYLKLSPLTSSYFLTKGTRVLDSGGEPYKVQGKGEVKLNRTGFSRILVTKRTSLHENFAAAKTRKAALALLRCFLASFLPFASQQPQLLH